jgi:hypothetical protein
MERFMQLELSGLRSKVVSSAGQLVRSGRDESPYFVHLHLFLSFSLSFGSLASADRIVQRCHFPFFSVVNNPPNTSKPTAKQSITTQRKKKLI